MRGKCDRRNRIDTLCIALDRVGIGILFEERKEFMKNFVTARCLTLIHLRTVSNIYNMHRVVREWGRSS